MAITIGRLGYLGIGLETTPGSVASASNYLPYTDVSLRAHHTPIAVTSSKISRLMDTGSVVGKKWSEGDIKMNLDTHNAGYLFKMAMGNENYTVGTPSTHEFYVTASGNTPKTASLYFGRDTDVQLYTYVACNQLTIDVKDGIGLVTASVQGMFPSDTNTATLPTTLSGTVLSFKDMSVQFGSGLTAATAASATPLNDFNLTISNNLELIYQSGSSQPSSIRTKGIAVKGTYTQFFNSTTDRDAYYNLQKKSMIVTFTGNANEQVRIRIPLLRLDEGDITTGLDTFFAIKSGFEAEDTVDSGCRLCDLRLQNDKASLYA